MKTYSKYKPSDIEWIGKIPSDWELKKLKHITYLKARVGWHGLKADEFSVDENLPYCITGTDFNDGIINWETCYRINEERYNEDKYIQLKENDLLVTKDGTIGKVAVVKNLNGRAILNSGVFVMRPTEKQYFSEFMYWLIQSESFSEFIRYTSKGSTIIHLYQDTFLNWSIALPSYDEQTAVASFLDEKTSQIDKLISNKQKLITLLKEERVAIIDETINGKGKNWERKKLKYLTEIISKGTTPSTVGAEMLVEGEVRFLKAENILPSNCVSSEPNNFIDAQTNNILKRSELHENDVLIVIAGATIGKIGILQKDLIPANTNQAVCFIRLKNKELAKWIWFYLQSNTIKENIMLDAVQSAQPNLSMEKLGNFVILMPSDKERKGLEKHIQTETQNIDETISKIEREIELMKEYRTALISEVVTGKIKVV